MKKQAQKNQKIETIIKRICRKVLCDGKKQDILNQLCNLIEHIEKRNYSAEEMVESFPVCAGLTYQELKYVRREVYKRLFTELTSSDHSMLVTYRICVAIYHLYPNKWTSLPMSNPKVKLSTTLWEFDNTCDFTMAFKMLSLMDKINGTNNN